MGAIMGAMLWANSTQMGFSGSTLPSPDSMVRPLRITSARLWNVVCMVELPRNRDIEARHDGEAGSRKAALVGLCPYRPSCFVRNPMIVR